MTEFHLEHEILKATQDWFLTHFAAPAAPMPPRPERDKGLGLTPDLSGQQVAAPSLTFADIPLGDSFEDEHGLTWEKRSERRAISWIQYEPVEVAEFKPTDIVRRK